MQEMDPTYEYGEPVDADSPPSLTTRTLRRLLYLAFPALLVLLLVLLPPLISAIRSPNPLPTPPLTRLRRNRNLHRETCPRSLTDPDFRPWLPDPQQCHLRIQARPSRTDTNVSDTGTIQLEGTLSPAASSDQVPINLRGEWRNVPLGQ